MLINSIYDPIEEKEPSLEGSVSFYFDHDIPIRNRRQFLKEVVKRAQPGEITITEEIKSGKVKYADKWIHDGWRLFCYDNYKISFKYNLDIRFERLVDGHFRRWYIFLNKKSGCLYLDKSLECNPNVTWGDFLKSAYEKDENYVYQTKLLCKEIVDYLVPFFHTTRVISISNHGIYTLIEDLLKSGFSLDRAVDIFTDVYNDKPIRSIRISDIKNSELKDYNKEPHNYTLL